jgi:hypothetical protein
MQHLRLDQRVQLNLNGKKPMSVHVPSPLADAIIEEYRLFDAQPEAGRAGNWEEKRRLTAEWQRALQQRLELTTTPSFP